MGNIDEKRLSGLLERIISIKEELEVLENEVRGILTTDSVTEPVEVTEPVAPITEPSTPGTESALATEPVAVTEPVEVTGQDILDASNASTLRQAQCTASSATEATEETPIDDTPIDIDFANIDLPPIIEDPVATYDQAVAPAAEPSSVTEPVEMTEETEPEDVQDIQDIEKDHNASGASASSATEAAAPVQENDDLPFDDDLPMDFPDPEPQPIPEPQPTTEPVKVAKPKAAILDSSKAETAVMDVMAEKQAWRTDRPGSQVKNVISAISLNDRVLLINVLFREDPILFQNTISAFNGMSSLDEAISYIQTNFPDWDMNSEPVYRLMMAVRRKLN